MDAQAMNGVIISVTGKFLSDAWRKRKAPYVLQSWQWWREIIKHA